MAKKRRKKTDRQRLTAKLDAMFSRWIRLSYRDPVSGLTKCATCDYTAEPLGRGIQCGHYWVRQHRSVRWDPQNCAPQCYACNVRLGGQTQLMGRFLADRGVDMEALERKKNTSRQWTIDELQDELDRQTLLVDELSEPTVRPAIQAGMRPRQ